MRMSAHVASTEFRTLNRNTGSSMKLSTFATRSQQPRSQQPRSRMFVLFALSVLVSCETAAAQESTLKVADSVRGKAKPTGVTFGLTAFNAPNGNGRRGANGIYIPPRSSGSKQITEMSFTYHRSGSARGVQVIHPLGDGHVVISILPDKININVDGPWPGTFGRDTSSKQLTAAFAEVFRVPDGKVISVRTRVFPNGVSEVAIDGSVVATASTAEALPFENEERFGQTNSPNPAGVVPPKKWPAGSAGIILGPLDGGSNVAEKIVFRRLAASSIPAPKVAMKAAANPKPATVSKPATSGSLAASSICNALAESSAVVKVASKAEFQTLRDGAKPAIYSKPSGVWKSIPSHFAGMKFLQRLAGSDRRLEFEVEKAGMIVLATSTRWRGGGSVSAEMAKEMTSRQGLLDHGWREFDGGLSSDNYPWATFYRMCQKGESFNIATEKYVAPTIILPLVANSKPATPYTPPKPAPTTVVTAQKLTLDTPVKRVLSVWGIHDDKGTYRVQLFSDGTTNQNYGWKPISRTKIEIRDGAGDLVDGGSTLLGSWKAGAIIDGRLLMQGCWVAGTTDTIEDAQPDSELDRTDRAFQENLVGNWQLTASNRRKKTHFLLPVQFSADHRVIEAGRTIATWTSERTQIDIQFLDRSIGAAALSPRKKDELSGRAKSSTNDLWTVRFDRIKALSTWDTEKLGTVVLYSNGRVSDPLGIDGHGFWWKDGRSLRFSRYKVDLSADQRSFSGTDRYRIAIKGTLLAGPEN